MRNLQLQLKYDGHRYHGWQSQKNAVTIEDTLRQAILDTTGEQVTITGCSRTDAGVHALQYVCNFHSQTKIPCDKVPVALNTRLPYDIKVVACQEAAADFNARYGAISKTYRYFIWNGEIGDPFLKHYACHYPYKLDLPAMERAAKDIVGTHDFSAFMAAGGSQKTTVRTVNRLTLQKDGDKLVLEINAGGYLYNMVRIITGTLLWVGVGKIGQTDIPTILASGRREQAGFTAPPQGLYLYEVNYHG